MATKELVRIFFENVLTRVYPLFWRYHTQYRRTINSKQNMNVIFNKAFYKTRLPRTSFILGKGKA